MASLRRLPSYGPGRRRLSMWYVTQRGDNLWNQVTGSPRQIDRTHVEAIARIHGMGGAYQTRPMMRMLTPR